MDIIYSIFGFIIGIGLLVIIHELGHFYAARWFNVRVLRFSIGFGPCTTIWYDRFGTEYVLSAIPLGGYVQLLDDLEDNNNLSNTDYSMAMNKQSPWVRMIIYLAGPAFSILFAVILYWMVFMLGIKVAAPIVGSVVKGSTADIGKLKTGLEIIKINDQAVYDWEDIISSIISQISAKRRFIKLQSYNKQHNEHTNHILNISGLTIKNNSGNILKTIGIDPFQQIDVYINQVIPQYPAFKSGIQPGDVIIALDNVSIKNGTEIAKYIKNKANKKIIITIRRKAELLNFVVIANNGVLGIKYYNKPSTNQIIKIHKYGVVDSFYRALVKTYNYTIVSFRIIFDTILKRFSLKNMAGPIAIGYYAGQAIKSGLEHFLNFLGLISISLGVLNLLPIPWLDGGSIVYCIYEILTGNKSSPAIINLGRTIGLIFLLFLMVLVFINDIARF